MEFQGIHFEVLMTLNCLFEAKQQQRKALAKEYCQCGSEEREGKDEAEDKEVQYSNMKVMRKKSIGSKCVKNSA